MKDDSLEAFLAALAAPTPTPGGGSASALAGSLAAALGRMVAGLARDRKGYEDAQGELRAIEARGAEVQARLLALVEADAKAYDAVLAAMRLPKGTESERAARVAAMQTAYRRATEVPLETAEGCAEALELAERAAEKGNRGATTDAGVAILLAEAAVRGAALNVRANLASLKDEAFRSATEERLGALLRRAEETGRRAMALVEGRL